MLRIVLAVLHLLGMAIAASSVEGRARALRHVKDIESLHRGFRADNWWGISAVVLIVTGLWRAFGSLEKSSSYYWGNHVFWAKMGLLGLVLALEIWPMITLIRWRVAERRGALPPIDALQVAGKRIALISSIQTWLVIALIVAAVMMARGYGA